MSLRNYNWIIIMCVVVMSTLAIGCREKFDPDLHNVMKLEVGEVVKAGDYEVEIRYAGISSQRDDKNESVVGLCLDGNPVLELWYKPNLVNITTLNSDRYYNMIIPKGDDYILSMQNVLIMPEDSADIHTIECLRKPLYFFLKGSSCEIYLLMNEP